MHWTAFLAYRRFPAHARVIEDCACIQCGYNLRMQMVSSRCPECGYEVGNSVFLLARPSVASRGLRTTAPTFLAPAAGVVLILSGAYWALFVVSLVAAVAGIFQFVGVTDLRRNAALARLPVIGSRLNFWWVAALLDLLAGVAWMIGMIVVSQIPAMQTGPAASRIVFGGMALWWVVNLFSACTAGRFGFALMDMLNYVWTRIEFRVQNIILIVLLVLTPPALLSIRVAASPTLKAILAGVLMALTIGAMIATTLPLLHAATACDESTTDWNDLIESDRIAVLPESQRPRKPEPPAIRLEGDGAAG